MQECDWITEDGYDWDVIKNYIKEGRGPLLFPVGTIFNIHHNEYGNIPFRVVGHDLVSAADASIQHTMCLDMTNILFYSEYNVSEALFALTSDTVFQADKIYYTAVSGSYLSATVEVNATIPELMYYERNADINRCKYGSNNPVNSDILQWANTELSGIWFEKKNIFDQCPAYLSNKNGFLYGLDVKFKNALITAQLTTAKAIIDGGQTVIQTAKMFPLSLTQVFGLLNNEFAENQQLAYYSDDKSRIKYRMDNGHEGSWWLRSPKVDFSYSMNYVYSNGSSDYYTGSTACSDHITHGVSLACIIG